VNFALFRPELERVVPRADGTEDGWPAFDHVLMCKILLPQAMHGFWTSAASTWSRIGSPSCTSSASGWPTGCRRPKGRLGHAWDVANAVLVLASEEGRYITGTELIADGGLSAPIPVWMRRGLLVAESRRNRRPSHAVQSSAALRAAFDGRRPETARPILWQAALCTR
jgi:hypothetical protein